jgi:hypothetical protein
MVAWGGGGGCASSLLQSLSLLGFLLIDCVKKDESYGKASSPSSGGIAAVGNGVAVTQVTAMLARASIYCPLGASATETAPHRVRRCAPSRPSGGSSCATSFDNPRRRRRAFHRRRYTLHLPSHPTTMTSCGSWQSWTRRMPMTMNARHPAQPLCS